MAVNDGTRLAQQVRKWWRRAVTAALPAVLSVLAAIYLHWGLARWAVTVIAGVLWIACVVLSRFIGRVVRQAASELVPRWGHLLADWVEGKRSAAAARLTKGNRAFGGKYRQWVRALYGHPELPDMLSVGFEELSLDDVFVDANLVDGPSGPMADGLVGNPPSTEGDAKGSKRRYLDTPKPIRLVILGVPGSGKTALLQHLASSLADRRHRKRRRAWPVVLRLRDCADMITNDPDLTLSDVVDRNFEKNAKAPPPGWFTRKLEGGRCVVMLDGLDDVVQDEARARVVQWLGKQIAEYRDNDYLITSRPYGYQHKRHRLEGAKALRLIGFTPSQRISFVRGWYLAVDRLLAGGRDHREALKRADDLLTRIDSNSALAPLAASPLLLTMMIDVERAEGELPKTRGALYRQMSNVLLKLRVPDGSSANRPDERRALLQALALEMMKRRTLAIPRGDVLGWISQVTGGSQAPVDPVEVLADIEETVLLVAEGRDKLSFELRILQEYLAAVQIAETSQERILLDNIGDIWWRETILLYVYHAGAGPIVRKCLERGNARALALALKCADMDKRLDPGLLRRLDDRLHTATDPRASPARRERVAPAIAANKLDETFILTDGTTVCRLPVARCLFELVAYQGGQQPDARAISRWAGNPDSPAVGVTTTEAAGLLAWLNRVNVIDGDYRLPTRKDTEDRRFTANQAIRSFSVWLEPEEGCQELGLWSGPGALHPYAIAVDYVRERAKEDAEQLAAALTTTLAFGVAHALAVTDGLARVPGFPANGQPAPAKIRAEFESVRKLFLDRLTQNTPHSQTLPFSKFEHAAESDFILKMRKTAENAHRLTYLRACRLARDLDFVIRQEQDASPQGMNLPRQPGRKRIEGADYAALNRVLDDDIGAIAVNDELELALCIQLTGNGHVSPGRRHVLDLVWGPDLDQVVARKPERAVLPGTLRRLAAEGRKEIEEMAKDPSATPFCKIAAAVAIRIDEFVSQADETDDELPRWRVSRARLGALAVAAGLCRTDGESELVHHYIDIAAGITALERRATGKVMPNEVVVLVRI